MADVKNKRVNIYIDNASAEQALKSLQSSAEGFNKKIEDARKKQSELLQEIEKAKPAAAKFNELKISYNNVTKEIERNKIALKENKEEQKSGNAQLKLLNDKLSDSKQKQADLAEQIKKTELAGKSTIRLQQQYATVSKEIERTTGKIVNQTAAVELLAKEHEQLGNQLEKNKNKKVELKGEIAISKSAINSIAQNKKQVDSLTESTNGYEKSLEKIDAQQRIVSHQIDTKVGPSLSQQRALVAKLTRELDKLPAGAQEFADKLQELDKAKTVLSGIETRVNGVTNAQKKMVAESSLLTKGGVFAAALAANVVTRVGSTITSFIGSMFTMRVEFEKTLANLSAITGASGADLEFLRNAAIDLSKEGTQSAIDYVEAMKLIASAKPELLEAKEDLVEVTRQAKLLADASGLDLPAAATKLTDALNQFGEPAARASVYVDALAAASKYGAAEVPEITEALLQFGTQAKSANIDIYESSAAIELLAEKGIKGAEAGTKLRNVFLALNAVDALDKKALDALAKAGVNTEILKDKTLSLEVRLKELRKISGDSAAMVQVFGKENFNAGQIILQNIPRYAELAKQIKEQGVASEQAATNTDTLANSWEQFKNILSSKFLEGSNSPVKIFVDSLTQTIEFLDKRIKSIIITIRAGAIAIKENLALAYEISSFDVKGARERMKRWDENEKASKAAIELKKKEIEINNYADGLAKAAGKETIQEQEKILKAEKGNLQFAAKKREELIRAGKQTTEEYKKNEFEYNQHARAILKINKSIATAKKAAGNATVDNEPTAPTATGSKADNSALKKALEDRKRLIDEYNQLRKSVNEDIGALLTPEASKKFIEILKIAERDTAKYYELHRKGAISKALLDAGELKVLERKSIAIRQLLEDEAKAAKPLTETTSSVDVRGLPKQLREALQNQPPIKVEVPIEILPEIPKENEAAVAAAMQKVIENIKKDNAAGNQVRILTAKNPVQRRDARLQELEDDYAETFTKIEQQRADIILGKRVEVDNTLLVQELEYQDAKNGIISDFAQEAAAIVNAGLQYAQSIIGVLQQFDQARSARENAVLRKELKQNEERKNSIKRLEDQRVISSQEAKRRLAIIDKEEDARKQALEKKQFERSKKMQITQAIINGAMAITSTLAALPGAMDILSLGAFRAINIGIAIATTAAQIAVISAQKFAGGGKAQRLGNGLIDVPSNIATQPNGDDVLATVKVGEVILNEEQQRLLGGANTFRSIGVPGFAGGGRISMKPFWQTRPYRHLNYGEVTRRSQKLRGYAEGGKVQAQQAVTEVTQVQNTDPALLETMQQAALINSSLLNTIEALNEQLAAGISVSLNKLEKAQSSKARIEKDSKFR